MTTNQQFSIFHGFFCSFFSKPFYIDAARRWTYQPYLFLLLLVILPTMPDIASFARMADTKLAEIVPTLTEKLPTIQIANGKATVDGVSEPTEIVLAEEDNEKFILVIDLTADETKAKSYFNREDSHLVVLTENQIYAQEEDGTAHEFHFSEIEEDLTISKESITAFASTAMSYMLYIGVPIYLFFLFIFRLFLALVMALFADMLSSEEMHLSFGSNMSLGIMVITPPILLSHLSSYLELVIPYAWILYPIIAFLYLRFALKALKETHAPSTAQNSL